MRTFANAVITDERSTTYQSVMNTPVRLKALGLLSPDYCIELKSM